MDVNCPSLTHERGAHERATLFPCRYSKNQGELGSAPVTSWLDMLQLVLIHAEIVAQFMDDGKADLFADFGLAGADRFNILLIKHNVIRPGY